jgi:hypothetical protein
MEDHHIAARRVADALRVIAENLPQLSAQASDHVYGLFRYERNETEQLNGAADAIEVQTPFEPLTEDEAIDNA